MRWIRSQHGMSWATMLAKTRVPWWFEIASWSGIELDWMDFWWIEKLDPKETVWATPTLPMIYCNWPENSGNPVETRNTCHGTCFAGVCVGCSWAVWYLISWVVLAVGDQKFDLPHGCFRSSNIFFLSIKVTCNIPNTPAWQCLMHLVATLWILLLTICHERSGAFESQFLWHVRIFHLQFPSYTVPSVVCLPRPLFWLLVLFCLGFAPSFSLLIVVLAVCVCVCARARARCQYRGQSHHGPCNAPIDPFCQHVHACGQGPRQSKHDRLRDAWQHLLRDVGWHVTAEQIVNTTAEPHRADLVMISPVSLSSALDVHITAPLDSAAPCSPQLHRASLAKAARYHTHPSLVSSPLSHWQCAPLCRSCTLRVSVSCTALWGTLLLEVLAPGRRPGASTSTGSPARPLPPCLTLSPLVLSADFPPVLAPRSARPFSPS